MLGFFGMVLRKAFAWLTGKFLGDVIVSAVVTLAVTAVFSGPTLRRERPVPRPALPMFATVNVPGASRAKPAFAVTPIKWTPESFALDVVPLSLRHAATTARSQAAPVRVALPMPPPRPATGPSASGEPAASSAPRYVEDVPPGFDAPPIPSSDIGGGGVEPDSPRPPPRRFPVLGGVISKVTGVGHSIASIASWL